VIPVCHAAGNVIETHEDTGGFREFWAASAAFTNASNFSGFSCLTVRLLCD
jgi:hypothetical protein